MFKSKLFVLLSLCIVVPYLASAQSIDFGRGEIPVTVPANDANTDPMPLIVLLHGYSFSGEFQDTYMGISQLADRYGFLFVAPDGNKEPGDAGNRFWNASPACCDFQKSNADDSGYVLSIIDKMKSEYNVDTNRVFLIGHSNGGFLSYSVAYEHPDTIAAIASLAGANHLEERSPPASPVHVLQIHGTADEVIAYDGADIQGNAYPGGLDSVKSWAAYNGCELQAEDRELRDLEKAISGHETSVLTFRQNCKTGGSSTLWTIAGGAHVPELSATFAAQVVEWLYDHPKPGIAR